MDDFTNKNLLVIDDEIEITRSIYRQFRRKYNVFTATCGLEALDLMEREHIQVVLSDQRMPGMTGVDFFGRIKDKYPEALKLILTGYSDIEAVVGAINEGQVFRYLTKPWIPAELEIAVKEAFEKYELITRNKQLLKKLHDININLENRVKERTKELQQANTKLVRLNQEKNQYIGIVAHDLRNPIGTAYSFSDLLIMDYDEYPREEKIEFIQLINRQCNYSLKLIENFLDVSKIESGILDLNFSVQDYCALVKDSVRQISHFARKKNQKIYTECKSGLLQLTIDKEKIEQVLTNLLSNAIKYSEPGKSMWVKVFLEGKKVITEVRDEGKGMPANEIDHIFVPFKTTSVKATAGEKSTGLGLVIVKKIVEAHQGEMTVSSKEGEGSVFTFSLPVE